MNKTLKAVFKTAQKYYCIWQEVSPLHFLRWQFYTFSLQISSIPFFTPFNNALISYFIVRIVKTRHNQYINKVLSIHLHIVRAFLLATRVPYHDALNPFSSSFQAFSCSNFFLSFRSFLKYIVSALASLISHPSLPSLYLFYSPPLPNSGAYSNQASVPIKFTNFVFVEVSNRFKWVNSMGHSLFSLMFIGFSAVVDMINHFLLLEIIYCLPLEYTSLLFSTSQVVSASFTDFKFSNCPLILEFSKLIFDPSSHHSLRFLA